jgi:hypothetical protein
MIPDMRRGRVRMLSRPAAAFVRATLAAACLVGLLALSLSRAGAQDGRGDARQACEADYHRLCAGISPGGGRIKKCLNDNFDALLDACKQAAHAPVNEFRRNDRRAPGWEALARSRLAFTSTRRRLSAPARG